MSCVINQIVDDFDRKFVHPPFPGRIETITGFGKIRCIAKITTVLANPFPWSQRKNGHTLAPKKVQRVSVIVIGKDLVRAKSDMILLSTRCAKGGGGPQY